VPNHGVLMRTIAADSYRRTRLRFTSYIKTSQVEDSAGLWIRVDSNTQEAIVIDNMLSKPIRGTTDWRKYVVTVTVPENGAVIKYGIHLRGRGQVWINDPQLEVVQTASSLP
ncbi:MAG: AraC family transcriptional regulator, partial [Acidobacteriota bacterium]